MEFVDAHHHLGIGDYLGSISAYDLDDLARELFETDRPETARCGFGWECTDCLLICELFASHGVFKRPRRMSCLLTANIDQRAAWLLRERY